MESEETIRLKILLAIERLCESIIEQTDQFPSIPIRFMINGQSHEWNGKSDDRDRRNFAQYIYVLGTIHRLVRTKARMNIRELFYSNVNLFSHQRVSDMVVNDIAHYLCVERRQLGFVASAKGLCAGCVQYRNLRSGDLIDCRKSSSGQLIIDDDICIVEMEQPLRFVLLVEKDTVFQHLLNDGFCSQYPDGCLVTGRGQPDHATRSFLVKLLDVYDDLILHILTDCDIFGVLIASVYHSCFNDATKHRVKWLGILPEEMVSFKCLHESSTLPIIDQRERRMIESFLKRSDINVEWRRQVSFLQQYERKMEIEAIYQNGTKSLMNDYLNRKLGGYNSKCTPIHGSN